MEVKNYFATDTQGNVLGSAQVYLYLAGTTTLATGLQNINGAALGNPFTSGANGLVQFQAPDNDYDLRVVKPGREFTIRIQCFDGLPVLSAVSELNSSYVKKLASYSAMDNYSGSASTILITSSSAAGTFEMLAEGSTESENIGIVRRAGNGRLYKRLYFGPVYAEWFGLKGDMINDDAPSINAAVNAIKAQAAPELYGSGGVVMLPSGKKKRMLIKSPVLVKFGITLMGGGSDTYESNLYVSNDFSGSAAIIARGDAGVSYTNAHVKSLSVSCNNVPGVGGLLFAGAYNNSSIQDIFINGVHGGSIGLEVRPMDSSESPTPGTVCESLLMKDMYVLHYEDQANPGAVTKPTIKLSKCQESTLINVKAFSSRNNAGSSASTQSAILIEDSRGITVIGGAAVGSKYGITISAVTRFASGFKISGFTHELVTDYGLRLIGTSSFQVSGVDYDLPRYEAPQPTNGLYAEYAQNCEIDTGVKGSVLGVGVVGMAIRDFGVGTVTADATARYVRHVTPNAVNNRHVIDCSAGIEIHAPSTPGFRFTAGSRVDYWSLNWSASDAVNNGFRLVHSSGRAAITANDNGTAVTLGLYGVNPVQRPTVTGSRSSGAALADLLSKLASTGIIIDGTSA